MNQRLKRLSDQILRTLAALIRDDLNDPRLRGWVTISSVRVSSDLGYADVYVTVLPVGEDDPKAAKDDALMVLKNASGFLRSALARTLKTRTTPRLRFHYDEATEHGNKMMHLIQEATGKIQDDT